MLKRPTTFSHDRQPAADVRRSRKSIAAFRLREGMPVGVAVTLRPATLLRGSSIVSVSIAIPRIRDFRGLNPRSFDSRGNYSRWGCANRSSSPRSTTTESTRCLGWTSRSRRPPPPTPRRSRCCRRWACPSPPRAGRPPLGDGEETADDSAAQPDAAASAEQSETAEQEAAAVEDAGEETAEESAAQPDSSASAEQSETAEQEAADVGDAGERRPRTPLAPADTAASAGRAATAEQEAADVPTAEQNDATDHKGNDTAEKESTD